MDLKISRWILFIMILWYISSCAPVKEATYFNKYSDIDKINEPDRVYLIENDYNEFIEAGDEIYISVTNGNNEPNNFTPSTGIAAGGTDLISYVVDNDGFVMLPYVGKIKLAGSTLNQAKENLESVLSEYLYTPSVSIRFVNSRISVIGEVNAPGVYEFTHKTINIYQAIAYAGDVSTFGNRKGVTIIRKENNNILKKKIDLTNDDILTSYWYNIKPGDIVYVEPLGRKVFGMETFDYGIITTLITTTMLIITFINAQ